MSKKVKAELTQDQKATLRKLEGIIRRGQKAFLETSQAILTIEREGLFLPHRSISAYCWVKWDMSASDVSRCRQAATILETLEKGGCEKLPTNESQARALANLQPSDQVTAWKAVIGKEDKITAALIRDVVKELFGEETNSTPNDKQQKVTIDFQPVIADLQKLDEAITKPNKLSAKDKECLRAQVVAAEKLLAGIKAHLG